MSDLGDRVRAIASFDGEILTGILIDRPDNADVDESYLRLDDGDERFIITNTIEFVDQPVPDATGRRRLLLNPITVLAAITLWVILLGLIIGSPW